MENITLGLSESQKKITVRKILRRWYKLSFTLVFNLKVQKEAAIKTGCGVVI